MRMSDNHYDKWFDIVCGNLASDVREHGESYLKDLEVSWLESTDEWVVNFGDEVLFDGMVEEEAERVKDTIYDDVMDRVKQMLNS